MAQETTGAIRGTVADPTGAVIPGATVELTSPALIRTATAKTESDGSYNFLTLPPGQYLVSVTAQGFSTTKRPNVVLQVGKVLRIDFNLEVGGTTQTVEVVSEAAVVDTSQATISANVSASSFDHLPKGRGFDSMIALAPGARYESKSNGYQVDGASAAENVFVIDGMDLTNLYSGALPGSGNIPFEFIQELQIKSSGFEAQYGGAMGGVINVITKSGSNEFHGDVGMYYRNGSMQARPRPTQQINAQEDSQIQYLQNQADNYRNLNPGVTIGGPIKHDKIWFFAGWQPEFQRWMRPVTFIQTGQSKDFEKNERRDYLNGKIDMAPTSKLRTYVGYIYSPYRSNGVLPARDGSSDPNNPWADRGYRSPAASYTFGADYSATPRLILSARGGYNYRNTKDYGIPRQIALYTNSTAKFPLVPAEWQQTYSGYYPNHAANPFTARDIQTRFRTNADASYIFNLKGQHTLKAGYEINALHNDPSSGSYPDGYLRFYWGSTYIGQAARSGETMKGTYGYLRYYMYGTSGNASSNNQALFLQDSWQVNRRVTLQLGLRTEREFVPSFLSGDNVASRAITFGFGQKLAPRLGFAYDVKGDGKWKVAGSFGLFYDMMKYAMPQGSFGGAKYQFWFYPLDNPDPAFYINKIPRDSAGLATFAPLTGLSTWEHVDFRIPSNDPNDNTIDPNLKPMRRRVYDISTEYALSPTVALSARYTHNQMDRAIEDVGTQSLEGEKYYIANPGYGITVAPGTWQEGFPVTPKAKRNYDAIEIRADKRFSNNYYFSTSYTWSRLFGNYSGLASSDEPDADGLGRMDPSVTRYFDQPWMSFDSKGKLVEGLLATDRPHTLKFFGSYVLKSKLGETNFGPSFMVMSGTPLSTQVDVMTTTPVFVNGRGDMGRTPVFSQTDFYVYHEFKLKSERTRVKVDLNVSNLFNQSTVTDKYQSVLHRNYSQYLNIDPVTDFFKGFDYKQLIADGVANPNVDLRLDPGYGLANHWQGPRSLRLGVKFSF